MTVSPKRRVLFLCTGNSARSQMAEAILRHQAGELFDVFSAGTEPQAVDPRALAVLTPYRINPGELAAKPVSTFEGQYFDYVITLCDKARRECKTYPNAGRQMAWDFEDPKSRAGKQPFETTLNELQNRIAMFVLLEQKAIAANANTEPEEH